MVRLEIDFVSMLRPPDFLDTELALQKVGRSSLTFRLTGRVGTRLCYRATCVTVFASADEGRSVPIPERCRAAIERELAIAAKVLSAEAIDGHG